MIKIWTFDGSFVGNTSKWWLQRWSLCTKQVYLCGWMQCRHRLRLNASAWDDHLFLRCTEAEKRCGIGLGKSIQNQDLGRCTILICMQQMQPDFHWMICFQAIDKMLHWEAHGSHHFQMLLHQQHSRSSWRQAPLQQLLSRLDHLTIFHYSMALADKSAFYSVFAWNSTSTLQVETHLAASMAILYDEA